MVKSIQNYNAYLNNSNACYNPLICNPSLFNQGMYPQIDTFVPQMQSNITFGNADGVATPVAKEDTHEKKSHKGLWAIGGLAVLAAGLIFHKNIAKLFGIVEKAAKDSKNTTENIVKDVEETAKPKTETASGSLSVKTDNAKNNSTLAPTEKVNELEKQESVTNTENISTKTDTISNIEISEAQAQNNKLNKITASETQESKPISKSKIGAPAPAPAPAPVTTPAPVTAPAQATATTTSKPVISDAQVSNTSKTVSIENAEQNLDLAANKINGKTIIGKTYITDKKTGEKIELYVSKSTKNNKSTFYISDKQGKILGFSSVTDVQGGKNLLGEELTPKLYVDMMESYMPGIGKKLHQINFEESKRLGHAGKIELEAAWGSNYFHYDFGFRHTDFKNLDPKSKNYAHLLELKEADEKNIEQIITKSKQTGERVKYNYMENLFLPPEAIEKWNNIIKENPILT
jgi:hypothetical protein